MKRISIKFIILVGIFVFSFSAFILYNTWTTTEKNIQELTSSQTYLALEFDLAIREYIGDTIRPQFEELLGNDEFIPECMSTSFVARSVFERVRDNFPDYVIKFSSDNPRNPANQAGPEELKILEYFREHPNENMWQGRIRIDGQEYYGHFSARKSDGTCLRCHGDPKDAPASLIKRYGVKAGFGWPVNEIVALDTVAIPMGRINANLTKAAAGQLIVLFISVLLLFGAIFLVFRHLVTLRLAAITEHFKSAVEQENTFLLEPVKIEGNDEIGLLAGQFNVLAEKLKNLHSSLEQRVEERTRDLQIEIKDRAKTQEALRTTSLTLRTIFNSVYDAIFIHDINGKILDVNEKMLELYNVTYEEALKYTIQDDYSSTENPLEELPGIWKRVLDGELAIFEWKAMRPGDGSLFDVEVVLRKVELGDDTAVLANVRDITRRKKVELEYKRVAIAMEQSAEAIIIMDTNGLIEYVNPAFETITGYGRDEVIGNVPGFLGSDVHDDKFYNDLWDTIRNGNDWHGRFTNKRKDGTPVEQEATISVIRDEKGRIINFVSVQRDITDELKLEMQLRQSQKMEAVGQLAGGVAHDFNNLLQAIQGYVQLAMTEIPSDNLVHSDLTQVLAASERASSLVRQLLTFSRRQTMVLKVTDINELIANHISLLRRVIGEHINLKVQPGVNLRSVNVDPGQIEQVLMNLCLNSRDAMPHGGEIIIETNHAYLDKEYCESHSWANEGFYVIMSVTDTGIGISDEILEHVFEPFFTTKDVNKGTGLGLATVYGIVKQHEGFITVRSQVGLGTSFKIHLPAIDEVEHKGGRSEIKPVVGGSETILLAEDDELVRNLASRILEKAGYRVFSAIDGIDAIKVYSEHIDEIDMAILDVIMPRLSGRGVHDRIKAKDPKLPILFSSGYSRDILDSFQIPGGDINIIIKPYVPNELLRKIREILDG